MEDASLRSLTPVGPARGSFAPWNRCLTPALLAFGCARVLGFQQGEPGADAAEGGTSDAAGAPTNGAPVTGDAGASSDAGGEGRSGSDEAYRPNCGNQRLDGDEACDDEKLRGASCASVGNGAGGRLRCTNCQYDLSDCYHVRSLAISEHVCVVLTNDALKCWGPNLWGQLGLGDTESRGEEAGEMGESLPFVDLGGRRVLEVSTGYGHTCALVQGSQDQGNQVVCWGSNSDGQLGQPGGDVLAPSVDGKVELGAGDVVQVAAGGAHTCALFDTGQVKCWGRNQHGQLGLGHAMSRGGSPGEMGGNLRFVDLGSDGDGNPLRIQTIAAGQDHTCVLSFSGVVKCWGSNWQGVLGIGSFEENRGEAPNELGDGLPVVDLGFVAEQLSVGGSHNCALSPSFAKCWGYNGDGQLGTGDDGSRGLLPDHMGNALPLVSLGPSFVFGGISAGRSHTCLWSLSEVKCWGSNLGGELGLGDTEGRGTRPEQMGANLPFVDLGQGQTISSVHAGSGATCAILKPGRVKCWGVNGSATLGAGHTNSVGVAHDQMGDALPFVEL